MTQHLPAVAIYAALNALILLVLSYNVGRHRDRTNSLNPGDTGDEILTRAIRNSMKVYWRPTCVPGSVPA